MRCKKHYTDLSSTVGVCASCLREHLLSLIAAQEQSQSQSQSQSQPQNLDEKHRNFEKNPAFPRSVSPYINCRKSDQPWPHNNRRKDHNHHHHSFSDQLFYRTPQVGPTIGCQSTDRHSHHNRRSFMRWLSFPKIFRSRNRSSLDTVSVPEASDSTFREHCGGGGNATSSSPSWFSNILHRKNKNKKKKQPVYVDESSVTVGRRTQLHYCRDRGMSPVRRSSDEGEFYDAITSGYESTESMKQTPRRTPAHLAGRRGGGGHARSLSGLTFCLSPMVRASPNRQWNQKGLPLPVSDGGFSGEIRAPVKPHLSNAKSFCANRSRKLADFGRTNPNR